MQEIEKDEKGFIEVEIDVDEDLPLEEKPLDGDFIKKPYQEPKYI